MRLCPRYTGDATRRTCRGCWREIVAEEIGRRDRGYLQSYCLECRRPIARRSARRRYWERGAAYRAAKVAAVCEARRKRRVRAAEREDVA